MSTFTVAYDGDVASDRWVLTLEASGATVKFSNADDTDELALTITGLTAGDDVVVDGQGRNVTVNGVDAPSKVAPGSGWPFLQPGDNDLTVTGGTGSFNHNPLYA